MTPKVRISDGLRTVLPYYSSRFVNVKGRWYNRPIIDVFTKELSFTESYISKLIENDDIYVIRNSNNSKRIEYHRSELSSETFKFKGNDLLYSKVHKHEPIISIGNDLYRNDRNSDSFFSKYFNTYCSFEIVHEDDICLVINKPSGVPIHPTGNYYHNTLLEILKDELKTQHLFTCHRLDLKTSGITIFGKTKDFSRDLVSKLQKRNVEKQYLAKVYGEFPATEEIVCSDPVIKVNPTFRAINPGESIAIEVKSALSKFQRISFDPVRNQSVVKCLPKTGRTHQLRMHLRNLGYPIVNDKTYCEISARNTIELQLLKEYVAGTGEIKIIKDRSGGELIHIMLKPTEYSKIRHEFEEGISKYKMGQRVCKDCGQDILDNTKNIDDFYICLHAYNYKLLNDENEIEMEFKTELPKWA